MFQKFFGGTFGLALGLLIANVICSALGVGLAILILHFILT